MNNINCRLSWNKEEIKQQQKSGAAYCRRIAGAKNSAIQQQQQKELELALNIELCELSRQQTERNCTTGSAAKRQRLKICNEYHNVENSIAARDNNANSSAVVEIKSITE